MPIQLEIIHNLTDNPLPVSTELSQVFFCGFDLELQFFHKRYKTLGSQRTKREDKEKEVSHRGTAQRAVQE
jgi:hypothetical protein